MDDFPIGFSVAILLSILSTFLLLISKYSRSWWTTRIISKNVSEISKTSSSSYHVPEAGGAWPIAGHLPLLFRGNLHRTLASLGDQCRGSSCGSPVFMIRIGIRRWLIVNEWEAVKECFTVNDLVLASRPASTTGKYIGHNHAIFALCPYGSYWRQMRMFMVNQLLSTSKLRSLGQLRASELDEFIKDLYTFTMLQQQSRTAKDHHDHDGNEATARTGVQGVLIGQWLRRLMINLITKMTAGKRYGYMRNDPEATGVLTAMDEFINAAGVFALSDAFPFSFVEWLDPQGNIRMMKQISKRLGEIIRSWVNEHQQHQDYVHRHDHGQQDFIDMLLSAVGEGKLKSDQHTDEIIIQAMLETVIIGGSNTMSATLIWLLSLLVNNRNIMRRAKEEMDQVVGNSRLVEEHDLKSLVYLQAVVKETLRLYPPIPLLVPHQATESCTVAGYRIPEGTRMLVNIWKIHRDPRIWTDPNDFRPERFLKAEGGEAADFEVYGRNFTYVPFGSGRRSCPGTKLALEVLQLTAARLLHSFDISAPFDKPVDMTEGLGNNLPRAVPLRLVLTPRLPHQLYLR